MAKLRKESRVPGWLLVTGGMIILGAINVYVGWYIMTDHVPIGLRPDAGVSDAAVTE